MQQFDKQFSFFLKKFGNPEQCNKADEEIIQYYKDKLPQKLLEYWEALGWCGYGEGCFWMVNPEEYKEIVAQRLKGTKYEGRNDLSVIARDAFGKLYVWAKGKGHLMDIDPNLNLVYVYSDIDKRDLSKEEEDWEMQLFWGAKRPDDIELYDKSDNPLFEKAIRKLGPLQSDEMYGWKQHIAIGGDRNLSNLDKQNIFVFHDIANQLEKPDTSMGIEGLL